LHYGALYESAIKNQHYAVKDAFNKLKNNSKIELLALEKKRIGFVSFFERRGDYRR